MQALLFDMDGLLLDTERVALASFLDATGPLGVPQEQAEQFFLTLVGTSSAVTHARVAEFLPDHHPDDVRAHWSSAMSARLEQGVPVKPTVTDALDQFHGGGYRMAVVTSTHGERARQHLRDAGLIGYFEHVTGGDEVSANKPDPAPYLETAAALGVDPAQCAAFEDSDRGLTAAHRAGCRAVQIPDLRPQGLALPDLGQLVAADLLSAGRALGLISRPVGAL